MILKIIEDPQLWEEISMKFYKSEVLDFEQKMCISVLRQPSNVKKIIEQIKNENYKWSTPIRHEIPKSNGKFRLVYTILYLIVNSQLKNIFDSNYYILFNKVPLCSSIKNFINETSYFSMAIYTLIHTVSFVLEGSLLNTIPFIILISISSVLTTSYNSSKNLNISIFNLINIVLATIYIILNDKVIAIVLTGLYIYILYRFLYTSINSFTKSGRPQPHIPISEK